MSDNILKGIGTKLRSSLQATLNVKPEKTGLIDFAFTRCHPAPKSFADLGGVWGINGAYTFHTLKEHQPERAFLVDTNFNDIVIGKSKAFQNLKLITGNFGEASIAQQVGAVDAIFLFDVLLHQVNPDWNQVLERYAGQTRYFVIYNQQWIGSDKTVRLLDLGREEYFKNVPHDPNHEIYKNLFDKMHEMHPQHNRPWRDIHNVWQWGITDGDLRQTLQQLGFKEAHYQNCGQFGKLKNFENHAFIFQKS
jgi:hypothetical protein